MEIKKYSKVDNLYFFDLLVDEGMKGAVTMVRTAG
jgi:hypothetical protein